MYTESTTTGVNIMDLNRKEAMMIRDSLKRVALSMTLFELDERTILEALIRRIDGELTSR